MIDFLGIIFHYFELAVIAAGLLVTGLLYIRLRPPGLVWVSVLAMGALLAHLYLEEGRWQLIPLYSLVFFFAIWLAIPGRKRYRTGGLILRIALTVFLLIPALLLPLAVPLFVVPSPTGTHGVGAASLVATPENAPSLEVTIRYPLAADSAGRRMESPNAGDHTGKGPFLAPYWSLANVESTRLPGMPWLLGTHLSLVPTRSILRGERADGVFPVVLALRSPDSVPSDYVVLVEQIASLGWIVVEVPASVSAEDLIWLLEKLGGGGLDAAFDGAVDTNRAVLLALGWDPGVDIGIPSIRIGGGELFSVVSGGRSYGIVLPESRIPDAALTNRYLLVRPSRLLVGSSDVSPQDINTVLTRTLTALLSDGQLSAPVFTSQPDSALAGAQSAFADLLPDLRIRSR